MGEPILGEVLDPDIRQGIGEIVRLRLGRGATVIDILMSIIRSSLAKEVDVSGPRAMYLLDKAMALLKHMLVASEKPHANGTKTRKVAEGGKARRASEEAAVLGEECCRTLDELYALVRSRPGLDVIDVDFTDVGVETEEKQDVH